MCGIYLAVASMAFQAYGAYQQSQSAKDAAEYQSAVARNNATVAEWQAQDAIKRGESDEARQRLLTKQLKGTQTSKLAANGIDISEGSALNILSDTDWMGEQDALNVRDNAAREAYGYRQQGANSSANAGLLKYKADSENPLMSATTSVMSNPQLGTVADKWYKMATPKSSNTNQSAGGSSSAWA